MSGYTASSPCPGYLSDVRVAPPDLLEVLGRIRADLLDVSVPAHVQPLARRLQEVIDDAAAMPVAEDVECGYDGEVDDVHYCRLADVVMWTCPRCGEKREEDAPGPDPDFDRKYALENGD